MPPPQEDAAAPLIPRVLVAQDRRAHGGGIESAVDDEAVLLQRRGHEVKVVVRDAIPPSPRRLIDTLRGGAAAREFGALIDAFAPHVIHVHDTDPLMAATICRAAARRGVPVVQTLHDYRLLCPQGELRHGTAPCESCVGHLPWRAVTRGCCPRRTRIALTAAGLVMHRAAGTWRRHVARWIVQDEYERARYVSGGLPASRVRVHRCGIDIPALEEMPRQGFLYVGRLTADKGIDLLVDACSFDTPLSPVRLAGSGPEAAAVQGHPRLQPLGEISTASVYEEMRRAVALVVPSHVAAIGPRVLAEAFALGLPVIASRAGALQALVEEGRTGLLFEPGSSTDLAAKLRWAENHPDRMYAMGLAARREYEQRLCHEAAYQRLQGIYGEVVAAS